MTPTAVVSGLVTLRSTFLRGEIDASKPPPLEVSCAHFSGVSPCLSRGVYPIAHERLVAVTSQPRVHFRRNFVSRSTEKTQARLATPLEHVFEHIEHTYHTPFPLCHPASLDALVFWEIPSQKRPIHVLVSRLSLGAEHRGLRSIIEEAEIAKVNMSTYGDADGGHGDREGGEGRGVECECEPVVDTVKYELMVEHDFESG